MTFCLYSSIEILLLAALFLWFLISVFYYSGYCFYFISFSIYNIHIHIHIIQYAHFFLFLIPSILSFSSMCTCTAHVKMQLLFLLLLLQYCDWVMLNTIYRYIIINRSIEFISQWIMHLVYVCFRYRNLWTQWVNYIHIYNMRLLLKGTFTLTHIFSLF